MERIKMIDLAILPFFAISPMDKMNQFTSRIKAKEVYRSMFNYHKQNKNKILPQVFVPSSEIIGLDNEIFLDYLSIYHKNLGKIKNPQFGVTIDGKDKDMIVDFFGYHLFGTWRNTLGIYNFDEEIFNEVVKSMIPKDTPISVFKALPEWSVYVGFPEKKCLIMSEGENESISAITGFWACFDEADVNGKKQLQLNIILNHVGRLHGSENFLLPYQIPINDEFDVDQAITESFHNRVGRAIPDGVLFASMIKGESIILKSLLSVLLWLCVQEPDISNIKGEPVTRSELGKPKGSYNKRTGNFVPPTQPHYYQVGERLGGEIRKFKDIYEKDNSKLSTRKRPHIRKGHWHGVWKGTGQNKHFDINWRPMCFVNSNAKIA